MNKKLLLSMFFVLIIFFLISTAQASDINITDSVTADSSADVTVQLDDSSSDDLNANDDTVLNENGKNQTQLTSLSSNIRGCYGVTLTGTGANVTLTNKTVYFSVDDNLYSNKTDDHGVARLILI